MQQTVIRIATSAAVAAALSFAGANWTARAQEPKEPESKGPASAEPASKETAKEDDAFQQRLFGRLLAGKPMHVCFSRVYDPAHLAQHPQQNVRTMLLMVKADVLDKQPNYELRIGVTFRKSDKHFESAGSCGSIHDADAGGKGIAHCGVDCDGGQIDVSIKDAKSVLVSIPAGARIWRAGSGVGENDRRKRFGSDDKVFRLDKTALTQCLDLADDAKEKAAMRRGE
ncbi:MAG TPA: hypothetical protein VIY51_26615 [Xanthobacteraceae bacterium]